MKKFKQLSTFWQMSILTFLVIISVVFITLIAQLAVVRIWAVKYEKDNIEAKYNEISMLLNTNNGIIYDELFENMDVDVIIYNQNKDIIYKTMMKFQANYNLILHIK